MAAEHMNDDAHRDSLLVELFVEELPPKALRKLGEAFAAVLADSLRAQGLADAESAVTPYASPRRLAAHLTRVRARGDDRPVSHKLMPAAVGLDAAGAPTTALLRKLAALGADASAVPGLARRADGKAESLFLDGVAPGTTLEAGLQKALDEAIARLPIPKVMRYQLVDGWTSVDFVRPAHGLVALHGAAVVPVRALGLAAGRDTRGHRFEAMRDPVVLDHADDYARRLRDDGAVIAGFDERRAEIARQLAAVAAAESLAAPVDDALLDEVTALVERPNVLLCRFDEEFLDVPSECLVLTMKANQKYFPLLGADGRLTNRFLVVSNVTPQDPSRVVEGNERVVRPRLADAKFFFDQDRRKTLLSRVDGLDRIVYHNQLGSQGERTARVAAIARAIGERLGDEALAARAADAARLAKADLVTDMVGEFPELQGVMGRYYAQADGWPDEVAFAVEDHYRPRFAGDELPRNRTGVVLALADKLETLVGLFGIGQRPTGDRDPYALRRHALGVVRLLVERDLPLSLHALLLLAAAPMPPQVGTSWAEAGPFVVERAKGYLAEQGPSPKAVAAVLDPMGLSVPLAVLAPILREADRFIARPEGQVLAEANKRITNILKKSGEEVPTGLSPRALATQPDPALFAEPEEQALLEALHGAGEAALALREAGRYAEALAALTPLAAPVKAFFDRVMVNTDDAAVRANRIALLQHARAYMNLVADLSLMAA